MIGVIAVNQYQEPDFEKSFAYEPSTSVGYPGQRMLFTLSNGQLRYDINKLSRIPSVLPTGVPAHMASSTTLPLPALSLQTT